MEFGRIFGTPLDISRSDSASLDRQDVDLSEDLIRSPRKQMFSDSSTPAYNQTSFKQNEYLQGTPQRDSSDTGFSPVQHSYAALSAPQQGDGGYGSVGDALSGSQGYNRYQYANGNSNSNSNNSSNSLSAPTSRRAKRESNTFFMTGLMSPREPSLTQLNENEAMGGNF